MKTIAEQLNVKEFPFIIKNNKGNEIYHEDSDYWDKREFDDQGNIIYFEDSDGYWSKSEYDSQGNEIYSEDSNGDITDNRPKTISEYIEVTEATFFKVFSSDDYQTIDMNELHSESHYSTDGQRGKIIYNIVSRVFQYYLKDINA